MPLADALPDYPASFYAALHRGTPGDVAFYRRACADAESVLELGCGDGRMLAALDAPTLHGLDLHDGLLDAARARLGSRATLHHADMRSFSLPLSFDRIILPFSGVYCLLRDGDLAACFAKVREHLRPGGAFILDAYSADAFHAHSEPEDVGNEDWTEVGVIDVDGEPYSVFERSLWDPDAQRIDVTYRHVSVLAAAGPNTRPVDGSIAHRYLLRHQLQGHLHDAGFSKVILRGGFEDQPLSRSSEHWVATALA